MLTTNNQSAIALTPMINALITPPSISWIELSKAALEHNLKLYKSFIGNQTYLAAVVKSNAYGHGLLEIARLCQESSSVDWLCTAHLSDALILRNSGITKPLLVLTYIDVDPTLAALHSIDLVVFDHATLKMLSAIGTTINKQFNVHLKIDTGMSRLGVLPHEAAEFVLYALSLPHITVVGLCTHFAESAIADFSFTLQQLDAFNTVLEELKQHAISIPIRHTAKSSAITNIPMSNYNLVRLGAGMYGLWASEFTKNTAAEINPDFILQPVMTWKTKVMALKKIPAGSFVGYDRTYQVSVDSTIAILPMGYYEGYDRRLMNKGIVRINNQNARVAGRICMNLTMVDVTHIPVEIGDEVILLGNYEHLTAQALAEKTGALNPREITTKIYPGLARVVV